MESIEVAERGDATLFVSIMDGTPQAGEVYVVTLTTSDGTADGTCVVNYRYVYSAKARHSGAFLSVTLAHVMRMFAHSTQNNCIPKGDYF